jgi:hypothetical protein
MKPKHYDIIIPNDGNEPFANCKLNRKQYAEVLTDIVSLYSDGFVLAVNNKWGTGKTTFIKMWEQHLKNKDYKILYFNAWENDFQSDVLVALLAELEVLADASAEAGFKKVLSKATPLLKKAGLGLVKGLAKKFGADEMMQAIIDGTAEATLDGLEDEIKSYTNRKKGIEEFRESLKAYVETLSNEKPVVFIIDELDRCRPNYAVEVLEQIKHLFSVEGIVFVLAIDKEQLGHAVRGVYGSDKIDADEYLRRFIDLEYSIPEPNIKEYTNYLFNYFGFDEFYNDQRNRSSSFSSEKTSFLVVFSTLFSINAPSLRIVEKMFSHIRLVLKSFAENQYSFPELITLLLYIKTFEFEFYKGILNKTYTAQELLNELDSLFINVIKEEEKRSLGYCVGRFVFTYCNYIEQSGAKKMVKYDEQESKNYTDLKLTLNQEQFQHSFMNLSTDFRIRNISLDWIFSKINLTEKLKI